MCCILGNGLDHCVQTTVKPIYLVHFHFSLSWMTYFSSMAQGRQLTSRLQSRVTGSFYPVSIQGRNSSLPTSALSREPSFSSQPLTGSRASSSILTESLKPQLDVQIGQPSGVWWPHDSARDLDAFDFTTLSLSEYSIYRPVALPGISSLKCSYGFCLISLSHTRSHGGP